MLVATIHYLIIDYPTCGHVLAVAIYSRHVEKNEICDDFRKFTLSKKFPRSEKKISPC